MTSLYQEIRALCRSDPDQAKSPMRRMRRGVASVERRFDNISAWGQTLNRESEQLRFGSSIHFVPNIQGRSASHLAALRQRIVRLKNKTDKPFGAK